MGSKIGGDDELIADTYHALWDIILVSIIFMVTTTTVVYAETECGEHRGQTGDSLGITLFTDGKMLLDGEETDGPALKQAIKAAAWPTLGGCLISAEKGVAGAYGLVMM